ncbi:MAG: Kae1-associated serine/threonine protein kinase [Candidatus Aenigmarchaeota archaeon]|nr:Kae1-associated serine/threonine protein kinase [Candidatus Aenigmarchaeota archaeon]
MQLIYQGAESKIYLDDFQNEKVIVKERIKKNYRIERLDGQLRKSRTRKEIKLLTEVRKLGILTPKILKVDEKDNRIIMEYVDGVRLKEFLNSSSLEEIRSICFELGKQIGKMHSNNVVHGDLTTSNMILKDGKVYFIDLSLGESTNRIEDKGVDLKLFREALMSTHYKNFSVIWENILSGYNEEFKSSDAALKQLKEIEQRARYMNREVSF